MYMLYIYSKKSIVDINFIYTLFAIGGKEKQQGLLISTTEIFVRKCKFDWLGSSNIGRQFTWQKLL